MATVRRQVLRTLVGAALLAPIVLLSQSLSLETSAATHKKHHNKHHKAVCKPNTIVAKAEAAGNFKILVGALKTAGLTSVLCGKGPFTVFAPDDAAWGKLPKAQRDAILADKEGLTKILKYHVVSGKLMASDLAGKTCLKSIGGDELMLSNKDGKEEVAGGLVTTPDITCSNGVIHQIDLVLQPR